ncbi:MAG: TetR family transcriptional regulator [Roseiarcus sp.]
MSTFVSAKLLDAAVATIRHRGYAGSSVDDICRAAGGEQRRFVPPFLQQGRARRRRGGAFFCCICLVQNEALDP